MNFCFSWSHLVLPKPNPWICRDHPLAVPIPSINAFFSYCSCAVMQIKLKLRSQDIAWDTASAEKRAKMWDRHKKSSTVGMYAVVSCYLFLQIIASCDLSYHLNGYCIIGRSLSLTRNQKRYWQKKKFAIMIPGIHHKPKLYYYSSSLFLKLNLLSVLSVSQFHTPPLLLWFWSSGHCQLHPRSALCLPTWPHPDPNPEYARAAH